MEIKNTLGVTCKNCFTTFRKPIDVDIDTHCVVYQFKCERCGKINAAAPDPIMLDYEVFEPERSN